ncbi:MAG: hypothetical protein LBC70_01810 [Chitinispirillales bacterium]|jgi:hypothetical protein|nr:hypothetical protein [Chitinispirillales bacterium]
MIIHKTILAVIITIVLTAAPAARAAGVTMFPPPQKNISAETLPYTQMLHAGAEEGVFYMRGRFATDFHFLGYNLDGDAPQTILFGMSAAAHVNILPTSSMRFPIDNFYATLALHFSGTINPKLSWRLYPIHHVSAHLADGYPDDIMKEDVHAVSCEMTRGEIYYRPFGEILELGAGAGWYYNTHAQKNLKYRADISILLTPAISTSNNAPNIQLKPFALLRLENVLQEKNNLGIDISAGAFSLNPAATRGLGLSLRYFNRLHSGYYFERYEKGWGAELMFLF